MDNHDYLVNNEERNNSLENEHVEDSKHMCSYQQNELTEKCSYCQVDTCGVLFVASKK